jgi:muconolactone delta-isomerase
MQKKVLATMTFDRNRSAEIMARVPAEQARIRELIAQGIVEALYLAATQDRAWLLIRAETQDEARRVVESLPLYELAAVELAEVSAQS